MNKPTTEEFAELMKGLVSRICESEQLSRVQLAEELEVSRETIFRAIYEAKIGFDLILKICRRAKATPEELWQVELAWMKTKEERPREKVFDHAMAVLKTLMTEIDSMEAYLKRKGLLDDYIKKRKGKVHPLIARSKQQLKKR